MVLRRKWMTTLVGVMGLLAWIGFVAPVHAATSVLLWPLDPVIEDHQRAAAVWVENLDSKPVVLQVRVFKWTMENYREHHVLEQHDVVASPPMAMVTPGSRQLIRLIKRNEVPAGTESAYRVVIDEIPLPESRARPAAGAGASSFGVKVMMRYSIPLFVSGKGVWTKNDATQSRDPADATRPDLRWRTEAAGGKHWLVLHNDGPVHAKFSDLRMVSGGKVVEPVPQLAGYVLPDSAMRWPLARPGTLRAGQPLHATVNGLTDVVIEAE